MALQLQAPVGDRIAHFRHAVEKHKEGGPANWAYLHDALTALVGVEVAALGDPLAQDVVERFRGDAAAALAPLGDKLRNYVEVVADESEQAEDAGDLGENDDWCALCESRSAVEVLLTWYGASPGVAAVERADVRRFDDSLRRLGTKVGPVEPRRRPAGMPGSHWWWWYPGSPPCDSGRSP